MWIGLKKAASAASLTASASVGWAWQVRARSSDEPPNSISTADLVDHLAGAGADDMGAEHPVGRCVGEDLDEAVGVAAWRAPGHWPMNGNLPTL